MENRIEFLSNDLADKLVLCSENRYNSLSIIIPYKYIQEKVSINWNDILFLIKNGYLKRLSAIEYAIESISMNSDERVTYLACSDEDDVFEESFWQYIVELADELPKKLKNQTKNKVMYVLLNWLYDNRLNIEDPIHILDIVFDDFDFPLILQKVLNSLHNLDAMYNNEQIYYIWNELLEHLKNTLENSLS